MGPGGFGHWRLWVKCIWEMTFINGHGMGEVKGFPGGRKAEFSTRICPDPWDLWQRVKRGHNRFLQSCGWDWELDMEEETGRDDLKLAHVLDWPTWFSGSLAPARESLLEMDAEIAGGGGRKTGGNLCDPWGL